MITTDRLIRKCIFPYQLTSLAPKADIDLRHHAPVSRFCASQHRPPSS